MEMPYPGHNPQIVGQSPFYYYNPAPSPESKQQQGHFTPQPYGLPSNGASQQSYSPQTPLSYPMQLYSRPPTSDYSVMPSYPSQGIITPQASPRAEGQKPTIVVQHDSPMLMPLDTSCANLRFMPGTPTLSTSGSAISSPPSLCEFLPTPVSGVFDCENFNGVKEGCEEEVFSEVLATSDWTREGSPPLSPGKFAHISHGNDVAVTAATAPSRNREKFQRGLRLIFRQYLSIRLRLLPLRKPRASFQQPPVHLSPHHLRPHLSRSSLRIQLSFATLALLPLPLQLR